MALGLALVESVKMFIILLMPEIEEFSLVLRSAIDLSIFIVRSAVEVFRVLMSAVELFNISSIRLKRANLLHCLYVTSFCHFF